MVVYFLYLLHLVLVCFMLREEVELPVSNVFMMHPSGWALLFGQIGQFDPCRLFVCLRELWEQWSWL